jgi:hypothetical protein
VRLGAEHEPGRIAVHSSAIAQRRRLAHRAHHRLAFIAADGAGNLGDDAMSALAQAALRPGQLERFGPRYLERRLTALRLSGPRYFSAGVLGGGTLICPAEIERVQAAVELGIPMWAIGTGCGSSGFEMERDVDISSWAPLLKQFSYIGVRGDGSAARLAAIGIPSEVVGDLALALAVGRRLAPVGDSPVIAVNLGGSPGTIAAPAFEDAVLDASVNALRPYAAGGWTVVPFATAPGDRPVLERLRAELNLARPVYVPASAEALIEQLAGCRLTLAMRLHSAVFSACAGVPPLSLSYREKCVEFMTSVGLADWSLDPRDELERLPESLARLEAQSESLRGSLLTRAQELGELSLRKMRELREVVLSAG